MTFIGEHKLLCHLDKLAALQAGVVLSPVNVEIDLTNRCNLGCKWCHFAHTHTKGPLSYRCNVDTGDVMDPVCAKRLLHELAQEKVKSITWTGGGEPTLHPRFVEIVQAGYNAGIDQGLYTNGTMITEEMASEIAKCCKWVYVSLDSATAYKFKEDKQVDVFYKALEGINRLTAANCTVGVGFLIGRHNIGFIPAMIALADSLNPAYVQFRPAVSWKKDNPSQTQNDETWFMAVNWQETIANTSMPIEFDLERFRQYGTWRGHGYDTCYWSALQTVITPDMRVWTCCNKRGLYKNCLGDLKKESFREIWSRRPIAQVDDQCRVLCRGHMGNLRLHDIFSGKPHGNFI